MSAWLMQGLHFVPLVLVISIVCASMKEDDVASILWKGLRFGATLTALTLAFALGIQGLMIAFL